MLVSHRGVKGEVNKWFLQVSFNWYNLQTKEAEKIQALM